MQVVSAADAGPILLSVHTVVGDHKQGGPPRGRTRTPRDYVKLAGGLRREGECGRVQLLEREKVYNV